MIHRLKVLRTHLHHEILGQKDGTDLVWRAIVRAELKLERRSRLLILGPTGVGKTELCLTFSKFLFEAGKVFRFDCSELNGPDGIRLLLGNRDGDLGLLGSLLNVNEEGTLLFDEVEKADPMVRDVLLQILEPGVFKLACGRIVDVTRFYVVATGNIGSNDLAEAYSSSQHTLEQHVLDEAREILRPEVFNRFDETLVFRSLDHPTELKITEQKLERYLAALRTKGYVVTARPEVLLYLVRHGMDRRFGARPILRAIRRFVGDAVAANLLDGGSGSGELRVDKATDTFILE